MATVNVTDENFDGEVLKKTKPVLVDFWQPLGATIKMR